MEELGFTRFMANGDQVLTDQVINCYRQVFGEEPWNEWKKCQRCDKKFGVSQVDGVNTIHCNMPLVDFWPEEVVRQDLANEIREETSCWLSVVQNGDTLLKVVGFSWGYPIQLRKLEEKIKFPGIAGMLAEVFGSTDCVAYQDEIGLMAEYRGHKLGKAMQVRNVEDYLLRGLRIIVARTKTNPPTVAYHWYRKAGMEVIGEYGDEDGRVILAGELEQLIF